MSDISNSARDRNQKLLTTIKELTARGKGILAADESPPTLDKRLLDCGANPGKSTREDYRRLLLETETIEDSLCGVILHEETFQQDSSDGTPYPRYLRKRGMVPGIKVDGGTQELPGGRNEKYTEGLDDLASRIEQYSKKGAAFAKWRAVYRVAPGLPTAFCLESNHTALTLYASICHSFGIVPIVEPEVLMDGDHDLHACLHTTRMVLNDLIQALIRGGVALEYCLVKPNMVVPGKDHPRLPDALEVAEATVSCLRETIPPAVPGIVFLSGGQKSQDAIERLNAIQSLGSNPWQLSFSFARALQAPVLEIWRGDDQNVDAARNAFRKRCELAAAARLGLYVSEMETAQAHMSSM